MTHLGKPKLSSVFFLLVLCQQTFQRDDVRPDGSRKPLYGPKPAGLLIFLPNGTYALQTMNPTEQKKFASGDRANGTPDEYKAAVLTSNPHWGKWKLNAADQALTFQIEYASFPNWAGTTQVRKFTLKGDELKYVTPNPSISGTTPEIVWKRMK